MLILLVVNSLAYHLLVVQKIIKNLKISAKVIISWVFKEVDVASVCVHKMFFADSAKNILWTQQ